MTIEQTVEIPANHRLVIDVPAEVPVGKVTITFAPVSKDADNDPLPNANAVGNASLPGDECPICAAKNYMPNAETIAAIEEGRAMMRGEIPAKWYTSTDEMWEELDRDDPDDPDDLG